MDLELRPRRQPAAGDPEREHERARYDAFSRLSVRELIDTAPSGTTHLIHDHRDRIVAEADGSGQVVREYVWLDGLPVAMLDGTRDPHEPALLARP